jgi:hypothetical protein
MKHSLGTTVGRVLLIGGIGLIFVAYLNFVPTALSSGRVADYRSAGDGG